MFFARETDEVKQALIADLAYSIVPTTIMGITIVAVGVYAVTELRTEVFYGLTAFGGVVSIGKIILVRLHRWRLTLGGESMSEALVWQSWHAALTYGMAGAVGLMAAAIFASSNMSAQLLATALVFGYCAGIVSRVSIRPKIAIVALIFAALPAIISAAWISDTVHVFIAVMFAVFLLGSFESVRFLYSAAVRQITMRLDMASLARADPLTGLANRLGLREAFERLPRSHNTYVVAHFFDLDGFKPVNDHYGHATGDIVLRLIGKRLRALALGSEIVARIGGDEFVVIQSSLAHPDEAELLARRIIRTVREPYTIAEQAVRVGASLGYASSPSATAELDELLARADAQAYKVKRGSGSGSIDVAVPD